MFNIDCYLYIKHTYILGMYIFICAGFDYKWQKHITDTEKAFDKTQYLFVIKTLRKIRIERHFFNFLKSIYKNTPPDFILNAERLNMFALR